MKRFVVLVMSAVVLAESMTGCGGGGGGGNGSATWIRQVRGTSAGGTENSGEWGSAIATDNAGNVYVTGLTSGTFPGSPNPNQGNADFFLLKFNSAGDNVWARQMGTSGYDSANGIAVDTAGNVFVAGSTSGGLSSSPMRNIGTPDLFLVKFDSAGNDLWAREMGSSIGFDEAFAVATDAAGNVYVAGITSAVFPGSPTQNQGGDDFFLVKFNPAGDNVWTRQMGSPGRDQADGVAVDNAGNIYVAGHTSGTLPGSPAPNQGNTDLFLVKFDTAGDNVWTRQMGSPGFDQAYAVAVDNAGNIYVAGTTDDTLPGSPTPNQGYVDIFLVKFNPAGDNVWTRQAGSMGADLANGVAVDNAGNIYVAGRTSGTLPGSPTPNQGMADLFLMKFNPAGEILWTKQMGSPVSDSALAVAVSPSGIVYVTGKTDGSLDGKAKAGEDADVLVLKYLQDGTGP